MSSVDPLPPSPRLHPHLALAHPLVERAAHGPLGHREGHHPPVQREGVHPRQRLDRHAHEALPPRNPHRHGPHPPPRRARRQVVIQHPRSLPGPRDPRPVGDASVAVEPPPQPHRVEEHRQRARRVDRPREAPPPSAPWSVSPRGRTRSARRPPSRARSPPPAAARRASTESASPGAIPRPAPGPRSPPVAAWRGALAWRRARPLRRRAR